VSTASSVMGDAVAGLHPVTLIFALPGMPDGRLLAGLDLLYQHVAATAGRWIGESDVYRTEAGWIMQSRAAFRNKGDCRNRNHDALLCVECRIAGNG
jgi:hypothetical protein